VRDPRLIVRLAAGAIFIGFGAAKFLNHSAEVDSFDTYGLPSPDAFVYLVGAIEVIGGALLVLGRATRVAALVLAADMIGAIVVSGLGQWEAISLTLAPALLVGMLYLALRPQLSTSGE
jgi:putative oxidoreductase